MKLLKTIILLLVSLSAIAQVPKYGDIKEDFPDISRKEYRQATSEYKAEINQGYEVSLTPLDRIISDVKTVSLDRSVQALTVDSWGRQVLMPDNIKSRVVNECGTYPVIVKTFDSGVDEAHAEYAGDWILKSSNYSGDPLQHWHGTHVQGITWQLIEDVTRQRGNFQLKGVQILNSRGSGSLSNIIGAIDTERSEDERYILSGAGVVVNNSWGATVAPIQSLEDAIQKSVSIGVVWTAAAGNTGAETPSIPASSNNTIAVGALTESLQGASFSTSGDFVDLGMPGQNINSTLPGNQQGKASGTSMADPFATGLIALAMGKYGKILHSQNNTTKYIRHICTDILPAGHDKKTGYGIPYVIKMLDTNPCDVPGIDCDGTTPPDDDDPPPPPTGEANYTELRSDDVFVMRWRYENDTQWRILSVTDIVFGVIGETSEDDISLKVSEWLPSFFNNRGIVLPPEMGAYSANWWTGKFLEYIAEQNNFDLETTTIEGTDEITGLIYMGRGFNSQNLMMTTRGGSVETLEGVKLIPIK